MSATKVNYGGKTIAEIGSPQTAVLKCKDRMAKSDIEIIASTDTIIEYNLNNVSVPMGKTAIILCNAKIFLDDITIKAHETYQWDSYQVGLLQKILTKAIYITNDASSSVDSLIDELNTNNAVKAE